MANPERAEKIKYWLNMGPEKMADLLWNASVRNQKLKWGDYKYRERNAAEQAKISLFDELERQNEILKDVLQDNGIRPKRLEVTYIEPDCKHCSDFDGEYCSNWNSAFDDTCKYKRITSTIGFYAYKIDDGMLNGIKSDFSKDEFDVVEVRDAKTGRLIYEYKGDEEED